MSILIRESRGNRPSAGPRRGAGPSVREVCLLGLTRPGSSWAPGDRLDWGGRAYRVSATQERAGSPADEGTRYVFLSAPADASP